MGPVVVRRLIVIMRHGHASMFECTGGYIHKVCRGHSRCSRPTATFEKLRRDGEFIF